MGQIVFADAGKRHQLGQCLHGLILFEMAKQILQELARGTRFVLLDAPLLFEAKLALHFVSYKLVVVCEDEAERLQRLLKRNPQLSEAEARQRMYAQMKVSEQISRADFVVDNSENLEITRKQVRMLMDTFRRSRKFWFLRAILALFSGFVFTGLYLLAKLFRM